MNLTRDEAERRRALIDVRSYLIDLDLTDGAGCPGDGTFRSVTTVRFHCRRPGASSRIDLDAARLHRATLNGSDLDVAGYRGDAGLELPRLAGENELRVVAEFRYSRSGRGLHRAVDPADGSVYLHTQFQPAAAARVFACFDQPDLKAPYRLSVLVPAGWTVVSNAPVATREPGAHESVRHTFEVTAPLSTYLVSLVAGPYTGFHDTYAEDDRTVPLGLYCRSSLAAHLDTDRLFAETRQGLQHFRVAFDVAYPFSKYDQCFVPEFHAGAMENAGCVTISESFVFRGRETKHAYARRCGVLLHEMAHMWFGNLVTMRWWDDLWLNESFATWAGVQAQATATEYADAWTTFVTSEKTWAYRQDRLQSTHPIAAVIPDLSSVELHFDGITYAKGAAVLKQLVAYVGEENFLAGIGVYLRRHAFGNATLADLLDALRATSGRDLQTWASRWLHTTGVNPLRPVFTVDPGGRFGTFTVEQAPAEPGTGELRPHRVAVGVYDDDGSGRLVRTHRVEVDLDGARTEVDDLVGVPRGRMILVNDDDLTYAGMSLDPDSLATLRERIADVDGPLPRALCWSAAWEMTRDARMPASDYLDLVLAGVGTEPDPGTRQRLLQQANSTVCLYVAPEHTQLAWRRLAARLLSLLRAAEPGSDRQLTYLHALASGVLGGEELAVLRGCLDGTVLLPGLVVDVDLRWRLLQTLVAHGWAGDAMIAAELARDTTARGEAAAATARAAVPMASVKRETWRRIVGDDDPPLVREHLIAGFVHPGQPDLLAGYVPEYVAALDLLSGRWPDAQVYHFANRLFPLWAATESTGHAVESWLRRRSPDPLRRVVVEGWDDLRRALAARALDATARAGTG